VLSEFEEKPHK